MIVFSQIDFPSRLSYFKKMQKIMRRLLPLLVAVFIFIYIFSKIHPSEVWLVLKQSNVYLFVFFSAFYFFWVHILDCLTIKHFISRFSAPITHKESWLVRGVTYLIMIINYHAAQGAFAVYFKKTHGASVSKTLGALVFISMADFILVLSSALIALLFTQVEYRGFDVDAYVLGVAPLIYVVYVLFILFWRYVEHPFIQKLSRFKTVSWILKHNVFLIFREARLKDFLYLFLLRVPLIVAVIGGYNLAVHAFYAHISWIKIFLYNPLIMFVSTLPITPAGLGTGQLLTIEFFKNQIHSPLFAAGLSTPASLLLTTSLLWFVANQVIKAVFGAICLFWTSSGLFKSSDA